jgi:hypothetical protein
MPSAPHSAASSAAIKKWNGVCMCIPAVAFRLLACRGARYEYIEFIWSVHSRAASRTVAGQFALRHHELHLSRMRGPPPDCEKPVSLPGTMRRRLAADLEPTPFRRCFAPEDSSQVSQQLSQSRVKTYLVQSARQIPVLSRDLQERPDYRGLR